MLFIVPSTHFMSFKGIQLISVEKNPGAPLCTFNDKQDMKVFLPNGTQTNSVYKLSYLLEEPLVSDDFCFSFCFLFVACLTSPDFSTRAFLLPRGAKGLGAGFCPPVVGGTFGLFFSSGTPFPNVSNAYLAEKLS